jgi:hypothetical protein
MMTVVEESYQGWRRVNDVLRAAGHAAAAADTLAPPAT